MFHHQLDDIIKRTNPEMVPKLIDGWAFGLNYCSSIDERNTENFGLIHKSEGGYGGFRGKFLLLEDLSNEKKISFNALDGVYSKASKYLNDEIDESRINDALVVKIYYEESGKCIEYKKFVHFSSIPFSKPRNRLCQKFHSDNFIIVRLMIPSINMSDIIDNINDPNCNDIDIDESDLRCQLLESLIKKKSNDELKKMERINMYKFSMNVDLFDTPLKIFDKEFEFLCCNSTGALVQKYIFVNKEIKKDVIMWAFDQDSEFNKSLVFLKEKPMVEPLRLSLLNSVCVPTVTIDGKYTYSVEDLDNNEMDVRDGCGLILSNGLIDAIIESYNMNIFSTGDDTDQPLRTHSFYELGSSLHRTTDLSYDLPKKIRNYRPCAFQIRYKGFKGMLIYHPYQFKENCDIYFTKSMKKFEPGYSDNVLNNLNIVGVSRPKRPTILSSELIFLFSGLSKSRDKMVDYLEKILITERLDIQGKNIIEIFTDEDVAKRLTTLRGDPIFENVTEDNILCENQIILGSSTFSNYLLTLNVPIPSSAHLYGVADFTDSLNPGEVFIQLTDENGNRSILDQCVLMTKTPALFRSDLRKFKAVNCEKLRHLYDVVVFSTKNPSLLEPSVMAGADLDGDHFYVFYDTDLIDNIVLFEKDEEVLKENIEIKEEQENETTVTSILLSPINTFTYCTLNHLLEIRRRFIDDFDNLWATNDENYKIIESIGLAITETLDAPKHGKWRVWKSSKVSTSIYGQIYEKILTAVLYCYCEEEPCSPTNSVESYSSTSMNTQQVIELLLFKSECDDEWLEESLTYFGISSKDDLIRLAVHVEFYCYCDSILGWECLKRKFNLPNGKFLKLGSINNFSNYIENCTHDNYFIVEHCLRDEKMWNGNRLRYPNIMQCYIHAFKIKKKYQNLIKIDSILVDNSKDNPQNNLQDLEMVNNVLKYLYLKLNWITSSKKYTASQHQVNIILQTIHWFEKCLKYIRNEKWDNDQVFLAPKLSRNFKPHIIKETTADSSFSRGKCKHFPRFLELFGWDAFSDKTDDMNMESFLRKALDLGEKEIPRFGRFRAKKVEIFSSNHVEAFFEITSESEKIDIIRKLEFLFSVSGIDESTQRILSEYGEEFLVIGFESKNVVDELCSYLESRMNDNF